MKKCVIIASILFAICSVVLLVRLIAHSEWATEDHGEATMQNGAKIVDAVYRFRKDTLNYPGELGELVPNYLSEIPRPLMGERRWHYHRYSNSEKGFYLREVPKFGDRESVTFEHQGGWIRDNIED